MCGAGVFFHQLHGYLNAAMVRVFLGIGQQAQQVLAEPLLVRDAVRADVCSQGRHLDRVGRLRVHNHAHRSVDLHLQLHGFQLGHQLEAVTGFGVVQAAVDAHDHEGVGGGHALQAGLDRGEVLSGLAQESFQVVAS